MGVKQHLGPFLSNLVSKTTLNNETLLTVNNSISNQLSKLDDMITKLGEVKNVTETNVKKVASPSDNVVFTHSQGTTGENISSGSTDLFQKFKINISGRIKVKFDIQKNNSSVSSVTTALHLNGFEEVEGQTYTTESFFADQEIEINVKEGDIVQIAVTNNDSGDNEDLLLQNVRICYTAIPYDYENANIMIEEIEYII